MRYWGLALLFLLAGLVEVSAQPMTRPCVTIGTVCAPISASNPLPISGTITTTPGGTQDVNLTQILGVAAVSGSGTATGALRVELPTNGTGVIGLNTGSNIVGRVGIDQTTPGTTNLVAAGQNGTWTVQPGNTANTTAWLTQLAGQSFVNITTNADTNVKGSAGTLVGLTVNTAGTTSTAKIYNDADGTCSSGLIATVNTAVLGTSLTFNAAATIGICGKTEGAGAADITILYR